MTKIWTLDGVELAQLRELLADPAVYRLRLADDGGALKVKANEYTWSPGIADAEVTR